jgi:hypothetical protein
VVVSINNLKLAANTMTVGQGKNLCDNCYGLNSVKLESERGVAALV